ncbi:adenosine deaminase, partial [Nocardiopsis sp. MG754419]|uniref:adenosine deaminase n=1 Tax=Nocardiopsis sp. MG754419 TaxID=2259865 RepID=UPI001BA6D146
MAIPKAELHIHIEGTLEPELAFHLADRNNLTLPFTDVDHLRAAYDFTDLPSFLDLYYRLMDVLRTEADFHDLAHAYLTRAAAQGVRHAEIFFDPQAHTNRGIPLHVVINGLTSALHTARTDHDLTTELILCFLRDRPVAEAMDTLDAARPHLHHITGVGLDSAEIGHPPADFTDVFTAAARLGLHRVAHAGEEGPADYIWQALNHLGVERIDHGIRCLDDPTLLT